MLVKYSCGCIGFADLSDKALVIEPCDTDRYDPSINFFWRDLSDKTYEPYEPEKAVRLMDEVGNLVADGHRYREIRSLLKL